MDEKTNLTTEWNLIKQRAKRIIRGEIPELREFYSIYNKFNPTFEQIHKTLFVAAILTLATGIITYKIHVKKETTKLEHVVDSLQQNYNHTLSIQSPDTMQARYELMLAKKDLENYNNR